MAKTKVTRHDFSIIDLVRDKPKTSYIEIPACRVDVHIEVTTTGLISASSVPSAALKRLENAARDALDDYEKVIGSEAQRLDARSVELMRSPSKDSQAEAQRLVQGVDASIRKALASAEGAAMQAVEKRLKAEAQGDRNLKDARVRTGIKVAGAVISVSAAAGRLDGLRRHRLREHRQDGGEHVAGNQAADEERAKAAPRPGRAMKKWHRVCDAIFSCLVPRRGLEPPRLAALVPETSASTNSAIWARSRTISVFAGLSSMLRTRDAAKLRRGTAMRGPETRGNH